jgi:hypothetical protein
MTISSEDVRRAATRPPAPARPAASGRREDPGPAAVDENDPLDGVPAAVLDATGGYDRDTAGGCG